MYTYTSRPVCNAGEYWNFSGHLILWFTVNHTRHSTQKWKYVLLHNKDLWFSATPQYFWLRPTLDTLPGILLTAFPQTTASSSSNRWAENPSSSAEYTLPSTLSRFPGICDLHHLPRFRTQSPCSSLSEICIKRMSRAGVKEEKV